LQGDVFRLLILNFEYWILNRVKGKNDEKLLNRKSDGKFIIQLSGNLYINMGKKVSVCISDRT
jgi:hypothetical protein